MKRWRTILIMLLVFAILCGTASAEPNIKVEVVGKSTIGELSSSPFTWAIDVFPVLRNTWLGFIMGLTVPMPKGEEIGFRLNGSDVGELLRYQSYYKTAGLVTLDLRMTGFELGEHAVKVSIKESDGNRLEREACLNLGNQERDGDVLVVYFVSKCKDDGTFAFDFYVDGEWMRSFEADI